MGESQFCLNHRVCGFATIIYIEQQSLEDEVMGFLELGFRTSNPKETPP
jgi:hypothetical protein